MHIKGLFSLTLLILFLSHFEANSQSYETDSLKKILPQMPEDSLKVNALNQLSYILFTSAPDESIDFGEKAKLLAEKTDYKTGLAYALKNIGLGYYMKGEYIQVLEYWNNSLEVFQSVNDLQGQANMLNNLGAIYYNQGDDAKAIEFYLNSLAVSEQIKDTLRIATALLNVGGVYFNKESTRERAQEYFSKALPLGEKINDQGVIGTSSLNLGDWYLENEQDSLALLYYEKSRDAWKGTGRIPNPLSKIGTVLAQKGDYENAIALQKQAIDTARMYDAKLEITRGLLALAKTYELQGRYKLSLTTYQQAQEAATEIGSNYELKDAYEGIAAAYANMEDFLNAYKYQSLLLQIKDTLFNIETDDKIKGIQFSYEIEKKQGEIDLLTKDKELQDLKMKRQKLVKNTFLGGFILVFFIAFITFRNYKAKVRINRILDNQKAQIESLLLNILPEKIASELQLSGTATPRKYESVSVLFSDFKDFTKISAQLTPDELITELNEYFIAFDAIMEKYNLEKIKTIGDAYMCAGGLPTINNSHPYDTINAAFDMLQVMEEKKKSRIAKNQIPWELRIGIHTGPVMAGVVGRKKYAYDIWGSTVNVASRMESNGEPGKINISESTYLLVNGDYKFHYRGKIMAKNVGEIDMYFVMEQS